MNQTPQGAPRVTKVCIHNVVCSNVECRDKIFKNEKVHINLLKEPQCPSIIALEEAQTKSIGGDGSSVAVIGEVKESVASLALPTCLDVTNLSFEALKLLTEECDVVPKELSSELVHVPSDQNATYFTSSSPLPHHVNSNRFGESKILLTLFSSERI